jgi:hypothetical protein
MVPPGGNTAWVVDYSQQKRIAEFIVDPSTFESWWEGRWYLTPLSAALAAIDRQRQEDERVKDFAATRL